MQKKQIIFKKFLIIINYLEMMINIIWFIYLFNFVKLKKKKRNKFNYNNCV